MRFLLPPLMLRLSTGCHLDQTLSKCFASFQKVKVLNCKGQKCYSFPNLYNILLYACVRNILKIVTFVTGKVKLVSSSLFLDAFPPKPKMPFEQWQVAINIYNICKGHLGSRGERGCRSQRRHQTTDKNRLLCQIVVFIIHQLYKTIYSIAIDNLLVYYTYMLLK